MGIYSINLFFGYLSIYLPPGWATSIKKWNEPVETQVYDYIITNMKYTKEHKVYMEHCKNNKDPNKIARTQTVQERKSDWHSININLQANGMGSSSLGGQDSQDVGDG